MFKSYKGWYKLVNYQKFIEPLDKYMNSFKDNHIKYKSKLELTAFIYADTNENISKWSIEPFNIKYTKPTDQKIHRYFVDMFLEFKSGNKFIVEIKPFKDTIQPKKPVTESLKSSISYQKSLMTFCINQAKWTAAKKFAEDNNMKFIVLTEKELYRKST
jgi:hypothetical protein